MDYAAGRRMPFPEQFSSVEEVTTKLVSYLEGMSIFGHPFTQQNVVAQPSIPSLIGVLLGSLYNPNLLWDDYSRRIALAEVEVTAITAELVGYARNKAAGIFTFGGTGTTLYGVKIGLEKACPNAMSEGMREEAVVLASDASHYCRYSVAGWLGLGTKNLVTVPTTSQNEIGLGELEERAREVLTNGKRLAAFIATLGTTDTFGLDDLEGVVALRDRLVEEYRLPYRPHIHADAVIGWAWAVFNDYDFEANPLGFRPRTVRALAGACRRLRHLHLADSIGVDFHKTGFAPYLSSLFLVKNGEDFRLLSRAPEQMPYLYHSGEHRPGTFTLETSRSGTGVLAALANLYLFGKEGMRAVLGHLVEMTQLLREHLEGHKATAVLNRDNFGTVTLFRVYPDGVDTFAIKAQELEEPAFRDSLRRHNDYNHQIYEYVHAEALAGRGVMISLTECYRREELARCWDYLAGTDAARAYRVMAELAKRPNQAEGLLKDKLAAGPRMNAERLARLIADLGSDDFKTRENASKELAGLGRLAEAALTNALDGEPSFEVKRRVQDLLGKLREKAEDPEQRQLLRVIEVLERLGTREARRLLSRLAKEATDTKTAREARASLERLGQLPRGLSRSERAGTDSDGTLAGPPAQRRGLRNRSQWEMASGVLPGIRP